MRRIAERSTKLVGGSAAYVERLEAEQNELIAAAVITVTACRSKAHEDHTRGRLPQVIQARKAIFLDDVARESRSLLISLRRAIMLERLEHSLHAREELQRVLAHDLRNPDHDGSIFPQRQRRFESKPRTRNDHLATSNYCKCGEAFLFLSWILFSPSSRAILASASVHVPHS